MLNNLGLRTVVSTGTLLYNMFELQSVKQDCCITLGEDDLPPGKQPLSLPLRPAVVIFFPVEKETSSAPKRNIK